MITGSHSLVTLNHRNRTVMSGVPIARSIFLIWLRTGLLASIAGVMFYLFGYRKRRSWIAFAAACLPEIIFMNIYMNAPTPYPLWGFWTLIMIAIITVPVYVLKIIAMCIAINEQRRIKTFLYIYASEGVYGVFLLLWMLFLPT